jgi:fermentation-respiration switch protein FrsA (DUF1100 family)
MKSIAIFLFWACVAYIIYCMILFVFQRKLMFPRYLLGEVPTTKVPHLSIEKLWLETSQGKTEAWYLAPDRKDQNQPAPAVIFAHGNGELIDYWPEELSWFPKQGIGLFLIEYPGYGRSQGAPSQNNISEVFLKGYDLLAKRDDVDPNQILLFGRSIGGGAICDLADKRPSAGIILMSTFTSARLFAASYFAPSFLMLDTFENIGVIKTYEKPVLIVHGKLDDIVPFHHGESLYKATQQGRLITYVCGHNDCPPDWHRFWNDVALFLSDIGFSANMQKPTHETSQ